jgi:phosphatidylglycerol lysyltransferase
MGDPVGPPAEAPGLIRRFLERCDDYDALPVFYEVSAQTLYRYADFGLTFAKLGEEARVPLDMVSLDGSAWKPQRQALRRLEREQTTFRIIPAREIPAALPELRAVSDEWLRIKAAAEKGFSLGFFDAHYLTHFPCAVIERRGQILAFASLWPSVSKHELSMDLMRHRESAPNSVMEGLLTQLMLWGKAEGYRWFNLGMAPLAGLEASDVTSLWVRLGAWIHDHGESYYNFQGLRSFKDKFNPEWEPRYLVFPGGLSLPRVLADVSALIAGGYRRILFK